MLTFLETSVFVAIICGCFGVLIVILRSINYSEILNIQPNTQLPQFIINKDFTGDQSVADFYNMARALVTNSKRTIIICSSTGNLRDSEVFSQTNSFKQFTKTLEKTSRNIRIIRIIRNLDFDLANSEELLRLRWPKYFNSHIDKLKESHLHFDCKALKIDKNNSPSFDFLLVDSQKLLLLFSKEDSPQSSSNNFSAFTVNLDLENNDHIYFINLANTWIEKSMSVIHDSNPEKEYAY